MTNQLLSDVTGSLLYCTLCGLRTRSWVVILGVNIRNYINKVGDDNNVFTIENHIMVSTLT